TNPNSYLVNFTTSGSVPGVNYFGLWFSALDSGNSLRIFNGDNLLYSFSATDYIRLVGKCPSSSGFCGNPNPPFLGKDPSEQFAYLSFFDTTGFFTKVSILESSVGSFEADNISVGYLNPVVISGTVIPGVPEPTSLSLVTLSVAL